MVIEVRQTQRVGDDVELEFLSCFKKRLRDGERIDVYGVKRKTAALCRGGDEADIKGGIVRHERKIANKVQKRAHGLRLARRAVHPRSVMPVSCTISGGMGMPGSTNV